MDPGGRSRCPSRRRASRLRRASSPRNHLSERGYFVVMAPRRSPLYMFIVLASWPVLRLFWRYEVRGLENLPPGGFVLAAGHHSNFDPWPLGVALGKKTRFVRFMAKSELFWWPLGAVIQASGGFKVRRGEADREAL